MPIHPRIPISPIHPWIYRSQLIKKAKFLDSPLVFLEDHLLVHHVHAELRLVLLGPDDSARSNSLLNHKEQSFHTAIVGNQSQPLDRPNQSIESITCCHQSNTNQENQSTEKSWCPIKQSSSFPKGLPRNGFSPADSATLFDHAAWLLPAKLG